MLRSSSQIRSVVRGDSPAKDVSFRKKRKKLEEFKKTQRSKSGKRGKLYSGKVKIYLGLFLKTYRQHWEHNMNIK